jgi:hypothetical protein
MIISVEQVVGHGGSQYMICKPEVPRAPPWAYLILSYRIFRKTLAEPFPWGAPRRFTEPSHKKAITFGRAFEPRRA